MGIFNTNKDPSTHILYFNHYFLLKEIEVLRIVDGYKQ